MTRGWYSLRAAVMASNTLGGDNTIAFDLNSMQCSTISLTTGQLDVTTPNLTIGGPATDVVTIDGGYNSGHFNRVFHHTGAGTLHLDHIAVTDAWYAAPVNQAAKGGCVYSYGNVYLSNSNVSACRVQATGGAQAEGGGVRARGAKLVETSIVDCSALSGSAAATGGGIYIDSGGLTSKDSTIDNNIAASYEQPPTSYGGGITSRSSTTIERTTISGNRAVSGAGLYLERFSSHCE